MKKFEVNSVFDAYDIIVFIGFSFIIVGYLNMENLILLNTPFIYGISLAGSFFVLADILRTIIAMLAYIKWEKIIIIQKVLFSTRSLFFFISFFHLIVTPYNILFHITIIDLENKATSYSIIAIGLTIVNIGLNSILDRIEEWENNTEETQDTVKAIESPYTALKKDTDSHKIAKYTTSKTTQEDVNLVERLCSINRAKYK